MAKKKPAKAKHAGGRPCKLTPQVRDAILKVVRETGCFDDACRVAGIGESTFYRWKADGERQASGEFREFWESVKKAQAHRRVSFERKLLTHGKRHWQAIAWLAERTEPARYALKVRVQVEQELGAFLERLRKQLTREEYEKVLDAAAGGDDEAETPGDAAPEDAAQHGGGEALQPPRAGPEAEGLP